MGIRAVLSTCHQLLYSVICSEKAPPLNEPKDRVRIAEKMGSGLDLTMPVYLFKNTSCDRWLEEIHRIIGTDIEGLT